eukprot:2236574-Pyramimonas_sp.AAC.1
MPAGIANVAFTIEVAELDQDAPMLISKDTQFKLGTVTTWRTALPTSTPSVHMAHRWSGRA